MTRVAGEMALPAHAFEAWIGREEESRSLIAPEAVEAMAATLDLDRSPAPGEALPAGWQWMFFNPVVRRSALGEDGHPRRGGFLPPIELPRRMWAGSRLRYLAELKVGAWAVRTSHILKIEHKAGRRGQLWFVTVRHATSSEGRDCIIEEQDIVYREASLPGATQAAAPERYAAEPQWTRAVQPDTTLLFRYSALTFNGHRIHYDQDYARQVEGYPELVVHGPLTATLLQQFALECCPGRRLGVFEFRGVSALHLPRQFTLEGASNGSDGATLWARGPDGELAMSASATLL